MGKRKGINASNGNFIMAQGEINWRPSVGNSLKMTSPRFIPVKRSSASKLVLILPVQRQKVKGISPSPLEVLIRSRQQEPTRSTDRTAITARFRHEVDARL